MAESFHNDDDFFNEFTLTGKKGMGIHTPEANLLRAELVTLLTQNSSIENWKFLDAVYKINEQQRVSASPQYDQLLDIVDEFIRDGSPEQINISSEVSSAIYEKLDTKNLRVVDFQPAVEEVFDLMQRNLTPSEITHFEEVEKLIRGTNAIAAELSTIISVTSVDKRVSFLNRNSAANEGRLISSANQITKTTLQEIYGILNQENTSMSKFKADISTILNDFNNKMTPIATSMKKSGVTLLDKALKTIDKQQTAIDAIKTPESYSPKKPGKG